MDRRPEPPGGATSAPTPVLRRRREALVEEVPIALVYNGVSHAVMLGSPLDLEDFAVGFSLSESIVERPGEVHDLEVVEGGHGIEVQMQIASPRAVALRERRRALAGRTGCGLCGVESLRQLARAPARVADGGFTSVGAIVRALAGLGEQQAMHHATGASHAAAWADWRGTVALVREDVGRHNALDKLIGAMARRRLDAHTGFIVVTSRASHEMVHKTASAGVRLLAAASAATTMAVRSACDAGLTLIGSAGRSEPLVYTHPGRLRDAATPTEPALAPARWLAVTRAGHSAVAATAPP